MDYGDYLSKKSGVTFKLVYFIEFINVLVFTCLLNNVAIRHVFCLDLPGKLSNKKTLFLSEGNILPQ